MGHFCLNEQAAPSLLVTGASPGGPSHRSGRHIGHYGGATPGRSGAKPPTLHAAYQVAKTDE